MRGALTVSCKLRERPPSKVGRNVLAHVSFVQVVLIHNSPPIEGGIPSQWGNFPASATYEPVWHAPLFSEPWAARLLVPYRRNHFCASSS